MIATTPLPAPARAGPNRLVGESLLTRGWVTHLTLDFARSIDSNDLRFDGLRTRQLWDRGTITNNELQYYDDIGETGIDPFEFHRTHMDIVARKLTDEERVLRGDQLYSSGLISSFNSEMVLDGPGRISALLQLPPGKGLWPAFWLYPEFDGMWPGLWPLPEIDVMERIGDSALKYYVNAHTRDGSDGTKLVACGQGVQTFADLTLQPHRYGIERSDDQLTWFFDDRVVKTLPLPSDMRSPLHFMLNLAVGGDWPGPPGVRTPFPARLSCYDVRIEKFIGNGAFDGTTPATTPVDPADMPSVLEACEASLERMRSNLHAHADEMIDRERRALRGDA